MTFSYLTTLFLAKPSRGSLPVFHTHSFPVIDNLLEEDTNSPQKNVPDARLDLGVAWIQEFQFIAASAVSRTRYNRDLPVCSLPYNNF